MNIDPAHIVYVKTNAKQDYGMKKGQCTAVTIQGLGPALQFPIKFPDAEKPTTVNVPLGSILAVYTE